MPRLVDVDCMIALSGDVTSTLPNRLEQLDRLLERAGIEQAWVAVEDGRYADPDEIDTQLTEACRSRAHRLRPQLTFVPSHGDHARLRRLADDASRILCRVVRICPGRCGHGFPLVDWAVSPLPEICEREGLAIAVDYAEPVDGLPWDEVVRFARSFPATPLLLIGEWLRDDILSAALDSTPNLLVQVSPGSSGEVIRSLVQRVGSHRFVFGSRTRVGGGRRAEEPRPLALESLGEGDAHAVCAGNAETLQSGAWQETFL